MLNKQKLCLGIESTAHTFGIAVMDFDGKVLSNEKSAFATKEGEGGLIPIKVAEHHVNVCDEVLKSALEKAKVKLKDIDLIAYSSSPGLGHTLRIGQAAAKSRALLLKKPLIGVNHCIAHLEIGRLLTKAKDPVLLYASGANTQVIAYEGKKYRIFGETLDIGVGNFIDVFAREIGLGFPGGPKIQKLAEDYEKKDKIFEMPYSVKGMDVSFGGLLTHVKQRIKKFREKHGKLSDDFKRKLAYSVQEHIFAMLLEVSERAMAHCNKNELLLGGGVACNSRLQEMSHKMCEERGAKCFVPERQFLVDNAAMIAWQGIIEFKAGNEAKIEEAKIDPYLRTDDIEVNWRD